MCALTYIPTANGQFVLTHNRDEHIQRPKALPPTAHWIGDREVWYPVDPQGQGTWIAWDPDRVACLLNGGFQAHERKPLYKMSRGQVILDLFRFERIEYFLRQFEFAGLEPFTLIIFERKHHQLIQIVWDERVCHVLHPNVNGVHIWSSATLYDESVRSAREQLLRHTLPALQGSDDCWAFHRANAGQTADTTLFIDFPSSPTKTVSTTQIFSRGSDINWRYEALEPVLVATTVG
jgi:uncharacterized protein with NRDE domain